MWKFRKTRQMRKRGLAPVELPPARALDNAIERGGEPTLPTPTWRNDYPGRIIIGVPSREFEARPIKTDRSNGLHSSIMDTVADGWSADRYCIRAASVRGDAHRFDGSPRQDDALVTYHQASGSLIVAVADGLSSARASHVGASTACRYATAAILESLDQGVAIDWHNVFEHSAWALVELARRRAGDDNAPQIAEELFATTLTIAFLTPHSGGTRLVAVGVGDSAVWRLREDALVCLTGGKDRSDKNEPFSSSTAALPRLSKTMNAAECDVSLEDVVLVMSDGVGDPLGDGSGLVGDLLRSELRAPPAALQLARIADFSRATFTDDRTLVAVWPTAGSTGGDFGG